MDALGSVLILPYFSFMSSYCKDFKQKDFLITIPQNNAKNANLLPNNGPMPIGSQIPNSYPNRYNQARKRNIANNSYNSAQYQQQYNSYYNPYDNDNISHYQNNNNYNSNPSKPIIKNYPQNILP